jgi:predicted TIM-barrel enzyme
MAVPRAEILEKFRAMIARGEPIVGGGAGTGLSAKCEEAGGIDLIVIYNSGRYRMAGRGSLAGLLAYGDANAIVVEMAAEVLPVVKRTPVLAGVNATDPFRLMDVFLDDLKRIGFSGVQNFPTVGIIDGTFRTNLEETGMGYGLEVDMIAKARGKDLLTTPYVFNAGEAEAMARAGADVIVCHMGLTTGGSIGAGTALKLEDCPALINEWSEAALKVNRDVILLAHGGPIAEPGDADFILKNTQCHGFYGASSMERLPTEVAMTEQTRAFKRIAGK